MYGDIAKMPRSSKVRCLLACERHSKQHMNIWNENWSSDWKRGRTDALINVGQWARDDDTNCPPKAIAPFVSHLLFTK